MNSATKHNTTLQTGASKQQQPGETWLVRLAFIFPGILAPHSAVTFEIKELSLTITSKFDNIVINIFISTA